MPADLDAAYDAVRKVFGIATITRGGRHCEKDKDAITALAKTYLHDAMTGGAQLQGRDQALGQALPP